MNKVVLIIGLPGSGKTYLAQTKYVPQGFLLIDDPSKNPEVYQLMEEKILEHVDMVVCDPPLCNSNVREYAIHFFKDRGYAVECVYFENNPEKCKKLIALRNDDRIIHTFDWLNYTIPVDSIPLKIYETE